MFVMNFVALGPAVSPVGGQHTHFSLLLGPGDLVVRSQLWGWRTPSSKSTEDPPCMRACCTLNNTWESNVLPLVWCGAECQIRCRPRHLTEVQNYEVRPKIVIELLLNGTLI
ncbi:hypothetical protein AVEN_79921-1 [Araneus ventricosus]|uniref:Uncharacterized protein n=1 Tax=Araneus ventricosus TaxID=182803 RepID=A0A4Y2GMD9_ARAVE|nr:hypothetical protein AVEN_79921-1 [Araneus ventricosus]